MKVMITYPPIKSNKGYATLGQNRQFQWFSNPSYLYPVIPASAATLLKYNDFDVIWKDGIAEGLTMSEYETFFEQQKPDIIAIETKTPIVKSHWKIISKLKEISPDTKFVIMGDHVTALPSESLEQCNAIDYVITGGDYDFSLLDLARHLRDNKEIPKGIWYRDDGNIKNTGTFELKDNLDNLPFIDRELAKWNLYKEFNFKCSPYTYIMSGRDCPWHKCSFCSWTTIYPKFRVRSPENVLDEIGMLIEKYKVKEIFDDTGTFPRGKWLENFCKGMIERGYNEKIYYSCNFRADYFKTNSARLMKKAGFRLMKVGLESANQKTLDKLNKGILVEHIINACKIAKKVGLDIHLTMMVGYPWETKRDALNTLNLAKTLMVSGLADILQATMVIPYPGTLLYKQSLENNWFYIDPKDYEKYDMKMPILKTLMLPEDIMKMCDSIYKDIFLSPLYMLRQLYNIRSFKDIKYILNGAKAVMGHVKDFQGKISRDCKINL